MYDPKEGRWLELDPIGFAGADPNLYRFVGNAPTNRRDPSGLIAVDDNNLGEAPPLPPTTGYDPPQQSMMFVNNKYQMTSPGATPASAPFWATPDSYTDAGAAGSGKPIELVGVLLGGRYWLAPPKVLAAVNDAKSIEGRPPIALILNGNTVTHSSPFITYRMVTIDNKTSIFRQDEQTGFWYQVTPENNFALPTKQSGTGFAKGAVWGDLKYLLSVQQQRGAIPGIFVTPDELPAFFLGMADGAANETENVGGAVYDYKDTAAKIWRATQVVVQGGVQKIEAVGYYASRGDWGTVNAMAGNTLSSLYQALTQLPPALARTYLLAPPRMKGEIIGKALADQTIFTAATLGMGIVSASIQKALRSGATLDVIAAELRSAGLSAEQAAVAAKEYQAAIGNPAKIAAADAKWGRLAGRTGAGDPLLAEMPGTNLDTLIEGAKPSRMGKLRHNYTNPGHHDPSGGRLPYNPKKSVLPPNHVELFNQSVAIANNEGKVLRWAVEETPNGPVFHRFEPTADGIYHWSGSTNGVTQSGVSRAISINDIPISIRR